MVKWLQFVVQLVNVLLGKKLLNVFTIETLTEYINHVMYYFYRKSTSCTHVSAVLHALANLNPPSFQLKPNVHVTIKEEEVPCTSVSPQWGIPSKKRKDSSTEISSAMFEKHDYSKPIKKQVKLIKDCVSKATRMYWNCTSTAS